MDLIIVPIIIRTAFNNNGWSGCCENANSDPRLFQCKKKIINVKFGVGKSGRCTADCWEQTLCSTPYWDSYPHKNFGDRAAGRVYFVYRDTKKTLVLWGVSSVSKVDGKKVYFNRFQPLSEACEIRGLTYQSLEEFGVPVWGSGTYRYIHEETADILDALITSKGGLPLDPFEDAWGTEGRKLLRQHVTRERSPKLVKAFKEQLSDFSCEVCGFSFGENYGKVGEEFIEAHHKIPIASLASETKMSISDLAAVCSNCHRMLHRENPPMTVETLTKLVKKHRK